MGRNSGFRRIVASQAVRRAAPFINGENFMITREQVLERLKECYDPEIPINIVDLGLVYEVTADGDRVLVRMTLTSSHCPLAGVLTAEVEDKLRTIEGVESARVELVWDPPWTPDRISRETRESLGF
jgi:metal-sulfur cluster biosynthetic enzyme